MAILGKKASPLSHYEDQEVILVNNWRKQNKMDATHDEGMALPMKLKRLPFSLSEYKHLGD